MATEVGVLGAMVGQIGTLQATEAIKLLLGVGQPHGRPGHGPRRTVAKVGDPAASLIKEDKC